MGTKTKEAEYQDDHGMGTRGGIVDYSHSIVNKFGDSIIRLCRKHSNPFDTFLDHYLHLLMVKPLEKVCDEMLAIVVELTMVWEERVRPVNGQIAWFDHLGALYEYCASHIGKKHLGQFFTPPHLCDMMDKLVNTQASQFESMKPNPDNPTTVLDPTCGSGRTLLAAATAWVNSQPQNSYRFLDGFYFCGNDLDYKCSKMCLINFILHGITGEVTCANGLFMENDYRWGYKTTVIPIWKWVMREYDGIIHRIKNDIFDDEIPPMMYQNKEAAIQELLITKEAIRITKHYQPLSMVSKFIEGRVLKCDLDKITYLSNAGADFITIVKPISKDESYQVASERYMAKQYQEEQKQKLENMKGTGLFADVKINTNVINIKKGETEKPIEVVKKKKKAKKFSNDNYIQGSLF